MKVIATFKLDLGGCYRRRSAPCPSIIHPLRKRWQTAARHVAPHILRSVSSHRQVMSHCEGTSRRAGEEDQGG
ncbi:uncharacterized [Tachysurus ichikawai]